MPSLPTPALKLHGLLPGVVPLPHTLGRARATGYEVQAETVPGVNYMDDFRGPFCSTSQKSSP